MLTLTRKYNTATTINFPLYLPDGSTLATGLSFAAGDVKFSNNEGTFANTNTTTPTEIATSSGIYSLALLGTEVDAERVVIRVVDATATQTWLDQVIIIETYGHTSATHTGIVQTGDSFSRLGPPAGASVSEDIADLPTVSEFNARTLAAADYFDPATDTVANVTLVATTTTNTDMRGTDSAATAIALATAQLDLDTITGIDGATLATAQGLYAPAKAGDAMALSAGAITNASLAGNMEIVFETDFATNYNTTRNAWVTNYTDYLGTIPGAAIAASALDGKGDWNVGKTGYSLTATTGLGNQTANITGNLSGSVGSVTGHTAQTGDTYALANGATGFAAIDTVVDNLNLGIIYGAAATGTLSTTQATTDLTGYADDQLIGRHITWTSGACEGEQTDITDYATASGLLTFTALTTAPGNGDTFKVT